jgi:hypothetical protein
MHALCEQRSGFARRAVNGSIRSHESHVNRSLRFGRIEPLSEPSGLVQSDLHRDATHAAWTGNKVPVISTGVILTTRV